MPDRPSAVVLRTAGTNCDAEMLRAFQLAGADAQLIHADTLARDPAPLQRASLVGFPGGFSHGDDVAAGRVLAVEIRQRLWRPLRDAARRGACMIGACNGFQVMVQAGLLPGADPAELPDDPPPPTVALAANRDARFIDDWPRVEYPPRSVCVWTRPLAGLSGPAARLPVAHGEGRFVAADPATLADLDRTGQIAVRYADDLNGSEGRIAGICDPSGRILGLMPHPERFLDWTRHPTWTALPEDHRTNEPPGLAMFRAAVDAVRAGVTA